MRGWQLRNRNEPAGPRPGSAGATTEEINDDEDMLVLPARGRARRRRWPRPALAQNEQFIPNLVYRTGAYAPNGIPFANGIADYYKLVNERDGGINGVKIAFEECDTGYATDRGVECYERLKGKGPTGAAYVIPLSTGITFALTEKAPIDKIPIITMGYGRSELRDGSVFQWNFPLLGTYWTAADIILQHIAKKEGGFDKLKGKKIALVYHDSPYGKEPIALLQKRAQMHGFETMLLPVTHPGVEQKATWLQIRQNRPDYVLLWGWGVMNSTAIKEAVAVGYPRDKMYGVWWSGAEQDVRPAEDGAKGYNAVTLQHSAGQFKLHEDLKKHVYDKDQGSAKWEETGEILYIRGLINAMLGVEAIRTAQEQVRQEAVDRRAGALGPREPQPHRRAHQAARLRGRAAADQGVVRRPRGRAHRPHPDLGRQELEVHVRLVHQRRQRDRADGRGGGREIRRREEDHARLPAPTDVGAAPSAAAREAAATPPPCSLMSPAAAARDPRRSTISRSSTITSSWCSRACRSRCRAAGSWRCSAPTAPARRPPSRRSPTCCMPSAAKSPRAPSCSRAPRSTRSRPTSWCGAAASR